MNNRKEMGVEKCGQTQWRNVKMIRIVVFMDFGKQVESGSVGIGNMEE